MIFENQQVVIFDDRKIAGKLLSGALAEFKDADETLVLGLPRGGVVVASEIARELNLPLDVVITRKVGHPEEKELALGAVDPLGKVIWDDEILESKEIEVDELSSIIKQEFEEIHRRESLYRKNKGFLDVVGRNIILVDDGIATGLTILSAISYLKKLGADEIIVAVPVADKSSLEKIEGLVDEVVVLKEVENLGSVGNFYKDFSEVKDEEVIELLGR